MEENIEKLKKNGYVFLCEEEGQSASDVDKAWKTLHLCASKIGDEIGLDEHFIRPMLFHFFCEKDKREGKFLSLSLHKMCDFLINNCDLLRKDLRKAMEKSYK